jgi:predicted ATPase
VRELIEAISGTTPSETMAAAVHEATEGNPLFVRETVRLLATDVTLADPGRLRVPLSGSVRTVIGRRLAPLSADAVLVLSAAAVVGHTFDLSLVGPACELPAERVLAGLSEAAALDVVAEKTGAVGRYRFSHALIREVLYERLPIPARVDLHRRVGEAIEGRHGTVSGAHVAELAHHFAQAAAAGDAAKAPARPASGPWACTPTRRPTPSTGGPLRPCGSPAPTTRAAAGCCCASALPRPGRAGTARRR